MRIAMLFEDNEESKLGRLLKSSYNSTNLFFSRSNTRLYKMAKSIYAEYDKILLFFDLCPNNDNLADTLESLSAKLYDNEMLDKVHIIPIVCSEYIYLNSLKNHFDVDIQGLDLVNTKDYHKSCEKYYKDLLEQESISIGSYSKNNSESEYFYISYPVFDIVDDGHKKLLESLSINFKETTLSCVKEKVVIFYHDFYSLFEKSFEKDILAGNIFLF